MRHTGKWMRLRLQANSKATYNVGSLTLRNSGRVVAVISSSFGCWTPRSLSAAAPSHSIFIVPNVFIAKFPVKSEVAVGYTASTRGPHHGGARAAASPSGNGRRIVIVLPTPRMIAAGPERAPQFALPGLRFGRISAHLDQLYASTPPEGGVGCTRQGEKTRSPAPEAGIYQSPRNSRRSVEGR